MRCFHFTPEWLLNLNAVAHCGSPRASSVAPRTEPQLAVKIWFWQTEASFAFQVFFFFLFKHLLTNLIDVPPGRWHEHHTTMPCPHLLSFSDANLWENRDSGANKPTDQCSSQGRDFTFLQMWQLPTLHLVIKTLKRSATNFFKITGNVADFH